MFIRHIWFKTSFFTILMLSSIWPVAMSNADLSSKPTWGINEQTISQVISPYISQNQYPDKAFFPNLSLTKQLGIEYTFDRKLQDEGTRLLKKYNPDYGILVALDPDTGRVLSMSQSTRNPTSLPNLATIATYPAASISKMITAIAGINEGIVDASTIIPFNGKSTTLYKSNVFNHADNQWTRRQSFKTSFGKSVNTVFGRLGALDIGGETMLEYAENLGFNARFASDFLFDNGGVTLDVEDDWQVVEMASGYTTRNTLSPLHAASLAASVVNGGNLIAPVIIEEITGPNGIPFYHYEVPAVSSVMEEETAEQLKTLMISTVNDGSAKKTFRNFNKKHMEDVMVGGKTGSLTGKDPAGKYDWFVGYGQNGDQKIAFAALCINKEKWYVKSTQLARELLEYYYHPDNQPDIQPDHQG